MAAYSYREQTDVVLKYISVNGNGLELHGSIRLRFHMEGSRVIQSLVLFIVSLLRQDLCHQSLHFFFKFNGVYRKLSI